ncbi:MAG: HAD family phosphatase [Thermodesulfobacteriota bacterium]|nr:HAD family phosphatase [Thermodesulfobacteriota bacterium]
MIKAVIFDFGRVITVQKPTSLFRTYEKELGLSPDTINSIMFESQAWRETLVGTKTLDEFWHIIGPELGLESAYEINRFRHRYQAEEAINRGVLDIIHRLYGQYRLAILSNAPAGLWRWLVDWEIGDLFDSVFCSGDEGMAKPDPDVFRVTLDRLAVSPDEAIFIDDTQRHVEAARRLEIHGIVFTTAEALRYDFKNLIGEI